MRVVSWLFYLALLVPFPVAAANGSADLTLKSSSSRIALIELFTSEGCNSCPPADKWLARLTDDKRLWKDFTPIAFHVDYWDYIGWKDRFAQAEFADRQRRYVAQGGARFVYTPGLFLDGQEWVGWRSNRTSYEPGPNAGVLELNISGDDVAVQYSLSGAAPEKLTVHVAILGMNLKTRVRAGENKGKTLRHDFVALGVESRPMKATSSGFEALLNMPMVEIDAPERAIVAWVSRSGNEAPLQSVGSYLGPQP